MEGQPNMRKAYISCNDRDTYKKVATKLREHSYDVRSFMNPAAGVYMLNIKVAAEAKELVKNALRWCEVYVLVEPAEDTQSIFEFGYCAGLENKTVLVYSEGESKFSHYFGDFLIKSIDEFDKVIETVNSYLPNPEDFKPQENEEQTSNVQGTDGNEVD